MSNLGSTDSRAAEPRSCWSNKVAELFVIGNGERAAPAAPAASAPVRPHPRPRRRAVAVPADAASQ